VFLIWSGVTVLSCPFYGVTNPGATQQALARKIGVSRSTVGRVVRARRGALVAAQ
jgi:hypothetical protein